MPTDDDCAEEYTEWLEAEEAFYNSIIELTAATTDEASAVADMLESNPLSCPARGVAVKGRHTLVESKGRAVHRARVAMDEAADKLWECICEAGED